MADLRGPTAPALTVAACLAAGIVLGDWIPLGSTPEAALLAGVLAAGAAAGNLFRSGRPRVLPWLAVTAAGTCAICAQQVSSLHGQRPFLVRPEGSGDLLTLWGDVRGRVDVRRRSTVFTVAADSVRWDESSSPGTVRRVRTRIRVVVRTTRADVRPHVSPTDRPSASDASISVLRPGLQLAAKGRFRLPEPPRNPTEPDYGRDLVRRGLGGTLFVRGSDLHLLADRARPWARGLSRLRALLRSRIERAPVSPSVRPLVFALILGDRSGLMRAERERWARAGLLHLLAISGLHVMLIGLGTYRLLGPLLGRLRVPSGPAGAIRAAITMGVLLAYTAAAGHPASAVRASTMATVLLGGGLLGRGYRPVNALGAAAILLLARDPAELFSAGFQLSFSAVGGILTLAPRWTAHVEEGVLRILRPPLRLGIVSLAATVATAPVTLGQFGYVTASGLVLNLVGVPAAGLLLAAAFVAVILTGTTPWLAAPPAICTSAIGHLLRRTAAEGDRLLSDVAVVSGDPGALVLSGISALVLGCAAAPRSGLRRSALPLGSVLLTVAVWISLPVRIDRPAHVLFFDTGQGDAILVRTPGGRTVLVDGGPAGFGTDAGRRILLPHLTRSGIDRIDLVVTTHPHRDHVGGLRAVLDDRDVGALITNGQPSSSKFFTRLLDAADSSAVPVLSVQAGVLLDVDPATRIRVMAPFDRPRSGWDPNAGSLLLEISYGRTSVLLTGDLEAPAERRVVDRFGPLLKADLVQVPHHGSGTSSTSDFVRAVRSRDVSVTAVLSVGRDNRYGLPDSNVVRRWRSSGARLPRTSHGGALVFRVSARGIRRVSWRPALHWYR